MSLLFPGPKCRDGMQITVAYHIDVNVCTCIWSVCISGGKYEAVPAYVMSQRWLRTRAFLTMPVKDAPRTENFITIADLTPLRYLHLHVIVSVLMYRYVVFMN